jgi:hypothetical protein
LSRDSSSTTPPTTRVRQVARLVTRLVAPLVVDYFAYAAHPGASACRAARHAARRRLLRLRRASGCLGTSCGSSRGSSSTTSPRAGSSSTTSPTPRARVPRHVARLVTLLVVDYFAYASHPGASHVARLIARLVVDYFTYTTRPVASARRVACCVTRRRLLRLRRASGCLGMSRGSSRSSPRRSSSTTSPTPHVRVPRHVARLVTRLVVDYFAYVAPPGASARHAVCHAACRRLLHLVQARRRLLRLRRASGCLGTSHGSSCGSSRGSSSTTSPTPRVRVPRLLARLVVDHASSCHSTSHRSVTLALAVRLVAPSRGSTTLCVAARLVVRSHWLYFSHAVHRDYLSCGNTGFTLSTPHTVTASSFASTTHLD